MNKSFCILVIFASYKSIGFVQAITEVSDITLEIACAFNETSYGVFTRKKVGSNKFVDVISDFNNVSACFTPDTSLGITAKCVCKHNVVCNITGTSEADFGDQWRCRTYKHGNVTMYSKAVVYIHREIYNTNNSFAFTTIDTNYANKSNNGESNAGDERNNKALSSSEIIMICAAVGVTLILAANISICAYWRLKTRSNDQQMTTVMLSNLDISSDENTNVHYHEIADIPIEFNTGPSPVETNMNRTHLQSYTLSPIEHVDNMTVTQKTESDNATNLPMGHLFQFVTGMNNEASSPRTDARAIEAGKPISFLALAEINMSDEVDGSSDVERDISRERNPEEVEPGHYENLDRTLREHGSQYSHLA